MNTNIDERNITELYLYQSDYYFIKGFACAKNFSNTLKALPLAEKCILDNIGKERLLSTIRK